MKSQHAVGRYVNSFMNGTLSGAFWLGLSGFVGFFLAGLFKTGGLSGPIQLGTLGLFIFGSVGFFFGGLAAVLHEMNSKSPDDADQLEKTKL